LSFSVGQIAVYPNHGLCKVEKIVRQPFEGQEKKFYCLRVLDNDMKVMVPSERTKELGLRPTIPGNEVSKLFRHLQSSQITVYNSWKGRFKDNSERMRTGSLYDVVEVLKSLVYLSQKKELSFREKRMLEKARYLLVSEIAQVEGVEIMKIEDKLDDAISRCLQDLEEED
jgi:CarD family transcriptional regulator